MYAAAQTLRAWVVTFVEGMALGGAEMVYLRTVVPGIEGMLDVDVRSALVAFVRDPGRWQDPMFGDHMPLLLAWTLRRRLTIGEAGGLPRGVGEFDGPAIPLYRMHESHESVGEGRVDVEHYQALVDPVWTYTGPPIAVDRVAEVVAEHRLPAMVVPAGLLAAGADDPRAVPSNNVGGLAGPGPADRFTVFADAQAAHVGRDELADPVDDPMDGSEADRSAAEILDDPASVSAQDRGGGTGSPEAGPLRYDDIELDREPRLMRLKPGGRMAHYRYVTFRDEGNERVRIALAEPAAGSCLSSSKRGTGLTTTTDGSRTKTSRMTGKRPTTGFIG